MGQETITDDIRARFADPCERHVVKYSTSVQIKTQGSQELTCSPCGASAVRTVHALEPRAFSCAREST